MQCPKCLNRYYGTENCPVCNVALVPDDDRKTINKRLKKTRTSSVTKPFLWLFRAALELTIAYYVLYFIFFYLCRMLVFLAENMEMSIFVDINSAGMLWLRHAIFVLTLLIYCIKRKRL